MEAILYEDEIGRRLTWCRATRFGRPESWSCLLVEGGGRTDTVILKGGQLSRARLLERLDYIREAGPWPDLELDDIVVPWWRKTCK